jgi:hypothetical protein
MRSIKKIQILFQKVNLQTRKLETQFRWLLTKGAPNMSIVTRKVQLQVASTPLSAALKAKNALKKERQSATSITKI